MRPGPLELLIILVVIVGIIILARVFRARVATPPADDEAVSKRSSHTRRIIGKFGLALVIIGAVYLVSAIGIFEMLGWALASYLWSLPVIIIGLAMVILTRRR